MKLYDFQKKCVRCITHFQGTALIGDDMGLGKTVEVIDWLKRHPKELPALVVCPATAKHVWESVGRDHAKLTSQIFYGRKPERLKNLLTYIPDLLIINYDILKYWTVELKKLKNVKSLILDECQYIKNRGTGRTRAVRRLVNHHDYDNILPTSGTPMVNRPSELFTAFNLVRPDLFPSFNSFAWEFCKPRLKPWGWDYSGASHTKKLHRLFTQYVGIRRTKTEVLHELPPKVRHVIPLDIDNRATYNKAARDFISWLKSESPDKARRAKKAEKITQLGYLRRLTAKGKLKSIIKWIEQFSEQNPNEKLVIFGIHRKVMLQPLYRHFKKNAVLLDGSTPSKKRKKIVDQFQSDKKTKYFFGNIKAAGTVITLTRSNNLAFAELDFVPGHHLQAEDRIHRITQNYNVDIFYLVAFDTIEVKLCKLLHKKQKIIQAIMDGKQIRKSQQFNLWNKLEEEILKGT